jgi:hypothetical protein
MFTPYAGAGMFLHINGKFTMGNWIYLFCSKVSFLTDPHCKFWDVGQWRYEAGLAVSVVSVSSRSINKMIKLTKTIFSERTSIYKVECEIKGSGNLLLVWLQKPMYEESVSYEKINKSARRGAQLVSMGMATVCWQTRPSNITYMMSIKNSENYLVDSVCVFILTQ